MLDPAKVRLIALGDAVEDYHGFYELIWNVNGMFPDASDVEKLEVAQSALRELFDGGLVELFAAVWTPQSYDPIDVNCGSVISDTSSWRSPSENAGGTYFAFAATEAGRTAYFSLPSEAFREL